MKSRVGDFGLMRAKLNVLTLELGGMFGGNCSSP